MSQPMPETRWVILENLKKHRSMSVNELAEVMELHPMSIRQHLVALERDRYVTYQRVRISRGRPVHRYQLTEEGLSLFPNNYKAFTLRILDGLVRLEGEEKLVQVLQAHMESLLDEYRPKLLGRPLQEQIEILTELLDRAGYMAEWDAQSDAFIIREHHCAIGAIAERYPQVCHQELHLLRKLLDTDVQRICHKGKGDVHCSYRIEKRAEFPQNQNEEPS